MARFLDPATVSSETSADGVKVVTLRGAFDLANVAAVRHRLDDLLERGRNDAVLDMSEVSLVDSTMLSTLVAAGNRAKRNGRQLVLVRPGDGPWRTFTVTGLDRAFAFEPDLASARARVAAARTPVRPAPPPEDPPTDAAA